MKKKKQSKHEYELTITKDQAYTLSKASELYARLKSGQLSELYMHCYHKDVDPDRQVFEAAIKVVRQILFPELSPNASYGVGMGEKLGDYSGDTAWDLYQVIRHRLAWDEAGNPAQRDWKTMMGVHYDEPMQFGIEPLAKMKKEKS